MIILSVIVGRLLLLYRLLALRFPDRGISLLVISGHEPVVGANGLALIQAWHSFVDPGVRDELEQSVGDDDGGGSEDRDGPETSLSNLSGLQQCVGDVGEAGDELEADNGE